MSDDARQSLEERQRAWQPGTSPWAGILPHFDQLVGRANCADIFGGIRDFVAAARSEPFLAARHVYPSSIALTIFRTSDPVPYAEAHRYPRVIVGPSGPSGIRVLFFRSQLERPEERSDDSVPYEPGGVKVTARFQGPRKPEPTLAWTGPPGEGIEVIRHCLSDPDDGGCPG